MPLDVPWRDLPEAAREIVLRGKGGFVGVYGFFAQMERKKYKLHVRVMLSKYRGYAECPDCRGQRLRAEARSVRVGTGKEGEKNICQASALTIAQAKEFFDALKLSPMQEEIAGPILNEVRQRLSFLDAVGLEYLTLDRLASTLSGGEAQRIQLATSLGSRLVGALYVLDEPSIGLHTRDTARLIHILEELRDLGNTILVVEHDADILRAADHLLDLGPGAGEHGGKLMAEGILAEIEANPNSLTGRYLSGKISIPVPTRRREPWQGKAGAAWRAREQSAWARRGDPAGDAGGDYGCFRGRASQRWCTRCCIGLWRGRWDRAMGPIRPESLNLCRVSSG